MQVVLRSDVDGLGKRGDIVDVADGHARNYLLPKGHALKASSGAVNQAGRMRQARDQRDLAARESATAVASALVPQVITVEAKAGSEGKLFGSVTSADIVDAVKAQTDIDLDRKHLEVDVIKTTGQHTVTASLHRDVSFPITLDVVAAVCGWTVS
ncbi:MAG: 50S ribosomal protein L9 [Acidimicrobiia bacterium]|nr:50S ribosomal protein L9 [Acidimicrobiia bacterium]